MKQIDLKTNLDANEALNKLIEFTASVKNFAKAAKHDKCIMFYSAKAMNARLNDAIACIQTIMKNFQ